MKKNWFFILLLAIASLALAGTAAYFSVFGLTKLFYAAGLGMTILAASLEFAKLVTVSYVYRFWKDIKKGLRFFYIFAIVFIMFLTSVGIYGFLTGAYQQSANAIEMRDSKIEIAENKKNLFVNQLARTNEAIDNSTERIKSLTNLRTQQEARMDTLYARNYITVSRRVEQQIENADNQIIELNEDINQKMREVVSINDSIAFYDQKIIEFNMSDVSNEIGPYKFVANLTGLPIDRVVNMVALLIVIVFDPLAVTLLIGVNQLTMLTKNANNNSNINNSNNSNSNNSNSNNSNSNNSNSNKNVFRKNNEARRKEEEKEEEKEVEEKVEKNEIQEFLTTTNNPKDEETDNSDVKKITSVKGKINKAQFIPRGHIQNTI